LTDHSERSRKPNRNVRIIIRTSKPNDQFSI
jgi:hypothetical protein